MCLSESSRTAGSVVIRCNAVVVALTSRLFVRAWHDADAEPLAALGRDPEFVRYLRGRPWTLDDAGEMIRHCRAESAEIGVSLWALEERESSALIGYCGLGSSNAPCLRPDLIEIGWGIERSRWGRGLATEAASAVIEVAYDRFSSAQLIAKCHIDNLASERVMQHIGLRRVGVLRYLDSSTTLYRST
jgi:RimJ/RimL family protein N-acetyltransferase